VFLVKQIKNKLIIYPNSLILNKMHPVIPDLLIINKRQMLIFSHFFPSLILLFASSG